jgi:hypothetical protein
MKVGIPLSEGNFLDDIVKSIKVPADITNAALSPTAKQIGEGLGDLFYLAFSPVTKLRIKKNMKLKYLRMKSFRKFQRYQKNN